MALYKQLLRPPITLLLANLVFVITGIITVPELLEGLSNQSIISTLLLILLAAGIRKNFEIERLFDRVYQNIKSYRGFLLAMFLLSLLIIFAMMAGFNMISMQDVKREIDLNLMAILVFSLAMGTAVVKSGAGSCNGFTCSITNCTC